VTVHLPAVRQGLVHQLRRLSFGDPIAEAALAPFRQVLLGEGAASEFALQGRFDLREIIQPVHQAPARFAVEQSLVQFVADLAGQAGDFTTAAAVAEGWGGGFRFNFSFCFHHIRYGLHWHFIRLRL
jgi:hypothetical protein